MNKLHAWHALTFVLELSDCYLRIILNAQGMTIWAEMEIKMHLNLCVNKSKTSTGAA